MNTEIKNAIEYVKKQQLALAKARNLMTQTPGQIKAHKLRIENAHI